jgi:hypothetical protein
VRVFDDGIDFLWHFCSRTDENFRQMQNGPHSQVEVRAAGKLLDTLRLGKRSGAVLAPTRTTTHGHGH